MQQFEKSQVKYFLFLFYLFIFLLIFFSLLWVIFENYDVLTFSREFFTIDFAHPLLIKVRDRWNNPIYSIKLRSFAAFSFLRLDFFTFEGLKQECVLVCLEGENKPVCHQGSKKFLYR